MNLPMHAGSDRDVRRATRREFLQVGALSGFALAMPGLLAGCVGRSSPDFPYTAALAEARSAGQNVMDEALGVALVTPARVVWAETYGYADRGSARLADAATMFGVASVSKVVAAVAAMRLVELGLVALDAPVVAYVPAFRMADPRYRAITVRMLLNHSSGIAGTVYRDYLTGVPYPAYRAEFLAALATQVLKASPGYMSVYCNDGFTVFELVVEAVTGMSYAQFVQAEILDPLGMQHSAYPLTPFAAGSFARAYGDAGPQPQEFSSALGAGGLYSTPADLGAFARLFLNGGTLGFERILHSSSIDQMAIDQTLGSFNPAPSAVAAFGLGWDTVAEPGLAAVGVHAWTKNGGSVHYGAQLLVAPEAGLGVVVVGLIPAVPNPLALAQRVLLRALTESQRIPAFPPPIATNAAPLAAPPSPQVLASIEGVYADFEKISRVHGEPDGSLTLQLLDIAAGTFSPGLVDLRLRTDGWFTAEAAPRVSVRFVQADGRTYLAVRLPNGAGHYLITAASAQQVRSTGLALAPAWNSRLDQSWLLVNEIADSLVFAAETDPRFLLSTVPGLDGVLVAIPPGLTPNVLDAAVSNDTAAMMLVIPGNAGRDLNTLNVIARENEEWLQWGGWMYRPSATVPALVAPGATTVAIGVDGYAEWRTVVVTEQPVTVTVSSAATWRLFDATFQLLTSVAGDGQATIAAASGTCHLVVFGGAGTSALVTVA